MMANAIPSQMTQLEEDLTLAEDEEQQAINAAWNSEGNPHNERESFMQWESDILAKQQAEYDDYRLTNDLIHMEEMFRLIALQQSATRYFYLSHE